MARNVVANDYCIEPCVRSLLGICDEVVIGYSSSTDNTFDFLKSIESRDSRIRVVSIEADFNALNAGPQWMIKWMDSIRKHIKGKFQVQLDCDEVISESSYDRILIAAKNEESIVCERLNFWGRADRISPHGHFCGNRVIRAAPSRFVMVSDFPVPLPEGQHPVETNVEVFHYSTLRKPEAFVKKSREFQPVLLESYDTKIDQAFESNLSHWYDYVKFPQPFIRYEGTHPLVARQWLMDRGHL